MRLSDVIRRWTSRSRGVDTPRLPEAFTTLHSADLDVHISGVARGPTARPPWPSASWERHASARTSEPSDMAKVLLEMHPAFRCADHPHWMQVEQAESLALEWTSAWFTSAEMTLWQTRHPGISAEAARGLVDAGLGPYDSLDLHAPGELQSTIDLRERGHLDRPRPTSRPS